MKSKYVILEQQSYKSNVVFYSLRFVLQDYCIFIVIKLLATSITKCFSC